MNKTNAKIIAAEIEQAIKLKPEDFIKSNDLPKFCDELLDLPYGVGHIQNYIYGRMKYPSRATAGIAALAAFGGFAMPFTTIESYGGLGLNEYFMVLAPTSFGKEDLRQSIKALFKKADSYSSPEEGGNLSFLKIPTVVFSAPASPQALHQMLQIQKHQFFMSDEFAEWLAQSKTNSFNQATLAYFMEIYTSALGTVCVPQSISGQYKNVENPRVAIFSTSTAERMCEVMTQSHADSGAYNRWIIFAAEQSPIEKKYEGFNFDPTDNAVQALLFLTSLGRKKVKFDPAAWDYFKTHDRGVIEPIRFVDVGLAGRLSEQAIKIAAILALSDKRLVIEKSDLMTAFTIRENLYYRSKRLLELRGAMSGEHETGRAAAQLRETFQRKESISFSRMSDYSRSFKKLSSREKQDVIKELLNEGVCEPDKRKGTYRSLLCN